MFSISHIRAHGLIESVSGLNLLVAITAGIVGVIYGYDLGAIASAILFLKRDLHLTDFHISVVTSPVVLGQLLGTFVAGRIANALGRKRTMVGVALGYALFAALQGLAPNMWFLTAVRFLLGFAIGLSIVTAPAFIAKSAPQRIRGAMLVTFQIATTSGVVLAYFVGAAFAHAGSWRLILAVSALPTLLVLALIIRLPETPRWLLMKNRHREAVDLLRRLDPSMDRRSRPTLLSWSWPTRSGAA